jgi:hypothetical protein
MVHRRCPSNTYGPLLWVRFRVLPREAAESGTNVT